MNGYSRTQDLDGRIPVRVAKAKWKIRALRELESNHPDRPTLTVEGDDYVIRDYASHQQTRADREAIAARNAANGKKGGRPPKVNRLETQSVSETEAKKSQSLESRVKRLETDLTGSHTSSPVSNRASETDEGELESGCARTAAALGVDFAKVRLALGKATGRIPEPTIVMRIIATVLDRATPPVKSPNGVVLASVKTDWAEWQKFIDTEGAAS